MTRAELTFVKTPRGFVIKTNTAGFPDQTVGPNLLDGRTPIKAFNLGMVWLEPEHRKVGAKTRLGDVTEETIRVGRETFMVRQAGGSVHRYFDKQTGFLVYAQYNPHGPIVELKSSTIPGL